MTSHPGGTNPIQILSHNATKSHLTPNTVCFSRLAVLYFYFNYHHIQSLLFSINLWYAPALFYYEPCSPFFITISNVTIKISQFFLKKFLYAHLCFSQFVDVYLSISPARVGLLIVKIFISSVAWPIGGLFSPLTFLYKWLIILTRHLCVSSGGFLRINLINKKKINSATFMIEIQFIGILDVIFFSWGILNLFLLWRWY